MPYADIDQQRECQREWFRERYHGDAKFRRKELKRKRHITETLTPAQQAARRDYVREYMRQYRAKLKRARTTGKAS